MTSSVDDDRQLINIWMDYEWIIELGPTSSTDPLLHASIHSILHSPFMSALPFFPSTSHPPPELLRHDLVMMVEMTIISEARTRSEISDSIRSMNMSVMRGGRKIFQADSLSEDPVLSSPPLLMLFSLALLSLSPNSERGSKLETRFLSFWSTTANLQLFERDIPIHWGSSRHRHHQPTSLSLHPPPECRVANSPVLNTLLHLFQTSVSWLLLTLTACYARLDTFCHAFLPDIITSFKGL